jgi:uncharacterized protein (DUF934 family)
MPKLIKLTRAEDGAAPTMAWADDSFAHIADDETPGANVGDVIVSFARFQAEGDALITQGRRLGVRLKSDEPVEGLAYDLPRLATIALEFPKFRDGRAFSSAALLRQRYGYAGEIRAVGDVLRDLAKDMVRVGFDAFEPADGSDPEQWAKSALRYRHVYQPSADGRAPAWRERAGEA